MSASKPTSTKTAALAILIAVQAASALFFVIDWLRDVFGESRSPWTWHAGTELLATLSLIVAIGVEVQVLLLLLRREARMIRSLSAAAEGLHNLMERHFATWGLTAAEQDVAAFMIKGCDIAEIARLRGSAEGTVKAHLNAIYRKAGVSGQLALVALLLEDLMVSPLLPGPTAEVGRRHGRDEAK